MKNTLLLLLVPLCLLSSLPTYGTYSHRKFKHASLKGSRKSQLIQNQEGKKEGLSKITTDKQLKKFRKKKILVPIPAVVKTDHRLKKKYCCCRNQTAMFLRDIAYDFRKAFGRKAKLQVNSAVRTVVHQKELRKTNGNAAKIDGPTASSHLMGATIDITKKGMTGAELAWVRNYLLNLESKKLIEATEEHKQPVFHLMVFAAYEVYHHSHASHRHKRHHK